MKTLKIELYKPKNAEHPFKKIALPLNTLDIGLRFIPLETKFTLEREGIDLSRSKEFIKEKDLKGTLIELENKRERIVIAAE